MNLTGSREKAMFERVIVIGMDGLDAGLTEKLMAAGDLPHFKQLSDRGGYARLATSNPAESPVAWSSIATGCDPGQHGIYDFLHRSPQTYLPFLTLRKVQSTWLGTKYTKARLRDGFWIYTSQSGIPTTVIRWPVGFPAEKVTGRFLAGFGVPDLLGGEGRYTYFRSVRPSPTIQALPMSRRSRGTAIKAKARYAVRSMVGKKKQVSSCPFSAWGTTVCESRQREASVELGRDEWSQWLPVKFSIGLGNAVHGQVKFFLTELEPNLEIVASPIHMDPVRQAFPLTWPAAYGQELRDELGSFHTLGMPEQIHPLSHERYDYAAFLAECETRVGRASSDARP